MGQLDCRLVQASGGRQSPDMFDPQDNVVLCLIFVALRVALHYSELLLHDRENRWCYPTKTKY